MHVTRVVMFGLAGIVASCRRDPPPPPAPPPPPPPAPSASAAQVDVDPSAPLKDVATKWNEAINARDIAALAALHGASVRFYGLTVDNATYCAKMKAALAKDPSFHQDIDSLRVEWPQPTRAKVSFRKKDGKAEHAAYLVMEQTAGSWKIAEESDLVTDANLKCVMSADTTMLTGTIAEGTFIWHDTVTPTTVLVLAKPICVTRSADEYWAWGDRMDGVDSVTLETEKPKLPLGTKVRVKGHNFQPHSGSGTYSTALLVFAESVTPLP